MAPIPRVSLASLQRPVAHAKWEESVEALGVSLGKHNVVVLALSEHNAAQLHTAMIAFPLLFRGSDRASWPQTPAPLAGSLSAPGQERFDLRLGAESTMSLPELTRTAFCEAYGVLDSVARLALGSASRASRVGLRSDTFTYILDDLPLGAGSVSSSVMRVSHSTESSLLNSPSCEAGPPETTAGGLVAVLASQHEGGAAAAAATKLQVRNVSGSWADVALAENEVAVVFGSMAHHVSGGLFTPASYRVVGDAFVGDGRRDLIFELKPQPAASLNFAGVLEEVGHTVHQRFFVPMTAQELAQQLDSAPPSSARSDATVLRHSSFSLSVQRARKRMASEEASPEAEPPVVTHATRSSRKAGAAKQPRVQSGRRQAKSRQAPVDDSPREEPGSDRRVCIDVLTSNQDPDDVIILQLSNLSGHTVWFRVSPLVLCGRIFEAYAESMGIELGSVQFLYHGERIFGCKLPAELDMEDEDEVLVWPYDMAIPPPVSGARPAAE